MKKGFKYLIVLLMSTSWAVSSSATSLSWRRVYKNMEVFTGDYGTYDSKGPLEITVGIMGESPDGDPPSLVIQEHRYGEDIIRAIPLHSFLKNPTNGDIEPEWLYGDRLEGEITNSKFVHTRTSQTSRFKKVVETTRLEFVTDHSISVFSEGEDKPLDFFEIEQVRETYTWYPLIGWKKDKTNYVTLNNHKIKESYLKQSDVPTSFETIFRNRKPSEGYVLTAPEDGREISIRDAINEGLFKVIGNKGSAYIIDFNAYRENGCIRLLNND